MVDIPVDVSVSRAARAGASQQVRRMSAAETGPPLTRPPSPSGPGTADPRPARADATTGRASGTSPTTSRATSSSCKFFGSVLGYVWQVCGRCCCSACCTCSSSRSPTSTRRNGPGASFYGAQLLGSIVLFTFFAEATGGAVRSVVDRENLVRKIQFPRLVIPLSVVLLAFFNLALNLVVVLIFALAAGVHPMLSWLELPLILVDADRVLHRPRDAALGAVRELPRHPADLGSRQPDPVLRLARDHLRWRRSAQKLDPHDHQLLYHLYMLNPLVAVFQQFRHAMITHATLSAGAALGSWAALLEPLAIVAAIFVLGFWVFNRSAPLVAENL